MEERDVLRIGDLNSVCRIMIEIAKYLDSISEKFSNAISLKEKEIEKLKEYKASLINSVVTGKVKVF